MSALKRKTDWQAETAKRNRENAKNGIYPESKPRKALGARGPEPGYGSLAKAPSYAPDKKRTEKQILTEKADDLFSLRIRRLHDWTCARCGDEARHERDRWRFECAHVVRRSFGATRWLDGAAICLCHGCHVYMTRRPLQWKAFLLTLGIDYDAFLVVARHGHVPKVADVIPLLRSGAGYQSEGVTLSLSSPAEVGH